MIKNKESKIHSVDTFVEKASDKLKSIFISTLLTKPNLQNFSVCQILKKRTLIKQVFPNLSFYTRSHDIIITIEIPLGRKNINQMKERLVVQASKKDPVSKDQIKYSRQIDFCTGYIRKIMMKYKELKSNQENHILCCLFSRRILVENVPDS